MSDKWKAIPSSNNLKFGSVGAHNTLSDRSSATDRIPVPVQWNYIHNINVSTSSLSASYFTRPYYWKVLRSLTAILLLLSRMFQLQRVGRNIKTHWEGRNCKSALSEEENNKMTEDFKSASIC